MQDFFFTLQNNQTFALLFFAVVGLCVGSFLNVVIYRVPIMMLQEWRQQMAGFMESQPDIADIVGVDKLNKIKTHIDDDQALTLSKPASHCPSCHTPIPWYYNLPLISWLILKGKCHACQQVIPARYPFIELVTALLSAFVVYKFGVTPAGVSALLLVWGLIALAGIDWDTQLLPDRITFPLALLGLGVNTQSWFVSPVQSILGLIVGFLCLWLVNAIFYLLTKKQGMGQGDFKLLAVLGAWLGVTKLPFIIFVSSLLGVVVGMILLFKHGKSQPFAFGPYLAIAGILALLFANDVISWYLNFMVL